MALFLGSLTGVMSCGGQDKDSVENYRKSLNANITEARIAGRSVLLAMSNGISKRFLEDFEYL